MPSRIIKQNIVEKIRSIRGSGTAEGGVIDRLTSAIEGFRRELSKESETPANEARRREPIPVIIGPGVGSPINILRVVIDPLVSPLVTAGLVVVFVICVLLESENLMNRLIKLAGAGDFQTSTEALSDAIASVVICSCSWSYDRCFFMRTSRAS